MFFTEAKIGRISNETKVITNIGNGKDSFPDYAIIMKDSNHANIIIKIKTEVACFDYFDFIAKGKYTILNYKIFESSSEAYKKMMEWIGKMCKKDASSRYFNQRNPYKFPDLNTKLYNTTLIDKLRKII